MRACILDSATKICINVTECQDLSEFTNIDAKGNKLPIELAPRHDGDIGWQWTNAGWINPIVVPAKTKEELTREAIEKRDSLLKMNVDSMNPMRYESMADSEKQAWRDYRQALLDVPQQPGFPGNITWPTKPE